MPPTDLHSRVAVLEIQMSNLQTENIEAKTDRKEILTRVTSLEKTKWMVAGVIFAIELAAKLPDLLRLLNHKP